MLSKAGQVIPLVALLWGGSASAGVNEFTITGVDGGYIHAIAAQPGNANLLLAGSLRGIHRSTNGGMSWAPTTPVMSGVSTHIEFDPITPSRAYVLNRQLYRSVDAGQTFTPTTDGAMNFDHLAIAGSRMYLGAHNGTIYRSDDGALTWTPLTVPWASPTVRMNTIGADPADNGAVYACVEGQGTYKSTDHGANWINPPAVSPCSGPFNFTNDIEVSPADADRIIASTIEGIFVSTNGGASWGLVTLTPGLEWVEFDPLDPDNVFGVSITGRVTRSSDGGVTWPFGLTGPNLKLDRVEGAAFAGAAGHWYIATPNGPMFTTDNGNTFTLRTAGIHAADVFGIISSDDGTIYATQLNGQAGQYRRSGGTWLPLDNIELQSRLLNPFNVLEIATSAENSSLLYVADQAGGLFRSVNGGVDWIDPPPSLLDQISGVAVDPTNPLRAYANKSVGGMMRTIDGGLTFTACGLSNSLFIRNVVVDRSSPGTLYGIAGYGPVTHIMKSTDSCASWADIGSQLPYYFNHIAVDPVDHRKVWLAHYGGVERSRDGGATWETVPFNFDLGNFVLGFRVLIDPVLPSTVWVLNADSPGFARSVDDGATWQKVTFSLPGNVSNLQHGVLDPLWPDTLVAGASGYGLVEYQVAPDLQVTLDAPPAMPTGTSADLTVNLRNHGPLDASAAEVTITLPAFIAVPSPPAGCTANADTVRCNVTQLRVNQTRTIVLTLLAVTAPGSGSVAVSVDGHESDPVSTNNSASAAVQSLRRANLTVLGPSGPIIGRTTIATLDFRLINQGPDSAENARVSFSIPAGLQATAGTSPAGACTVTAALVTCSLGTLPPAGASTTAQVRVQGMTNGMHNVSTQFVSDAVDTGQSHTAITPVVVQALADFAVEIAALSGTRSPGTPFPYTITVRNVGPDAGTPRVDMSVGGAAVTTAVSTSGTCTVAGVGASCQLAEMANGAAVTVTLTVNAATAGTAMLEAAVVFAGTDPAGYNDRATRSATVTAPASPGGGGGGGGGGRFDWLGALLLGGLLMRRAARS